MRFEGPSPFSERPASLELARQREIELLGRFRGRTARWLAAAMLLLTSEGCASLQLTGQGPETPSAASEAPKSAKKPEDPRRAKGLPSEDPKQPPTWDDYLTSPDTVFGRRPLLYADPEDINNLSREARRRQTMEKNDKRDVEVRKQRRF